MAIDTKLLIQTGVNEVLQSLTTNSEIIVKLEEFLKKVGGVKADIVSYSGKEALEAVKESGYALRYVNEAIFE